MQNSNATENIDTVLRSVIRRIPVQCLIAFVATIIVAFIVHTTMLTNEIANWDSISPLNYRPGQIFSEGKWGYLFFWSLMGQYRIASMIIPLSILFLGISASLVVSLFKLQSKIGAITVGLIFATFPSIVIIFIYHDGCYFITTATLAIFSVWLIRKIPHGFLWGLIPLTLSIGNYQSYISFACGLLVLLSIQDALMGRISNKQLLTQIGKYLGFILLSIIFYLIILKLLLIFFNYDLSSYRGINEKLSFQTFKIETIVSCIAVTYYEFFNFIWNNTFSFGDIRLLIPLRLWVIVAFGISVVCIYRSLILSRIDYKRFTLIVMLMLFIPPSVDMIQILSMGIDNYWIMGFPFIVMFMVPVLFLDYLWKTDDLFSKDKFGRYQNLIYQGGAITISLCVVMSWYYFDQICYEKSFEAVSQSTSLLEKIAIDVTSFEGFDSNKKIAFVWDEGPTREGSNLLSRSDNVVGIPGAMFPLLYRAPFDSFMSVRLGYNFNTVDLSVIDSLKKTESYKNMPVFPNWGYVQDIDGIIVCKLG